jgi:DNA-directed RNA polymerase subunit RPC12/RpoP
MDVKDVRDVREAGEEEVIKFTCPRCEQDIEAPLAMAGQIVACPGCGHKLMVQSRLAAALGKVGDAEPQDEEDRLRERAAVLTGWGIFFVVGCVICLLVAGLAAWGDDPSVSGGLGMLGVAGGCLTAAVTCFAFGQIFHIRAALEREGK